MAEQAKTFQRMFMARRIRLKKVSERGQKILEVLLLLFLIAVPSSVFAKTVEHVNASRLPVGDGLRGKVVSGVIGVCGSTGDPSPPSGDYSYMLCDSSGTPFSVQTPPPDAEKGGRGGRDSLMCWAAAASNALEWTGWGKARAGEMSTCDAMFSHFVDHWSNAAGNVKDALNWWFDGSTGPSSGGQFWKVWLDGEGQNFGDYCFGCTDNEDVASFIRDNLVAGYGVTIELGDGKVGHGITVWGFTWHTDASCPNSFYLSGIYVTDSDDDKGTLNFLTAPNRLRYYLVSYDSMNKWWSTYSPDWHIMDATALKPFPNQPPIAAMDDLFFTLGQPAYANAATSGDPDGWLFVGPGIVKYEWDLDGDGKFEITSTDPGFKYTWNGERLPGTVTLRVTDVLGATAECVHYVTMYGSDVSISPASLDLVLGTYGTFDITICNKGNRRDTFDLTFVYSHPPATDYWYYEFSTNSVELDPYESYTLQLRDVTNGDLITEPGYYQFSIWVTSQLSTHRLNGIAVTKKTANVDFQAAPVIFFNFNPNPVRHDHETELKGILMYPDGSPLADCSVEIHYWNEHAESKDSWHLYGVLQTDSNGFFSDTMFDLLPAGFYGFEAGYWYFEGSECKADAYLNVTSAWEVKLPEALPTISFNFIPNPSEVTINGPGNHVVSLKGIVVDAEGSPWPEVVLQVFYSSNDGEEWTLRGSPIVTDEHGFFGASFAAGTLNRFGLFISFNYDGSLWKVQTEQSNPEDSASSTSYLEIEFSAPPTTIARPTFVDTLPLHIDPSIRFAASDPRRWRQIHIELSGDCTVYCIGTDSIMLDYMLPIDANLTSIGDYNLNHVPDLTINLDRMVVSQFLLGNDITTGNVTLSLTCLLYNGTVLEQNLVITVHMAGDVNVDGKVDIRDVAMVAAAFGSYPGHQRWDPLCDETEDGRIDIMDVAKICSKFGTVYDTAYASDPAGTGQAGGGGTDSLNQGQNHQVYLVAKERRLQENNYIGKIQTGARAPLLRIISQNE